MNSLKLVTKIKEQKKQTQIFEVLSDSLLRDEVGREYQWFEDEVK
ncbi:hypothetical protein [Carnobacterium jeotgali]